MIQFCSCMHTNNQCLTIVARTVRVRAWALAALSRWSKQRVNRPTKQGGQSSEGELIPNEHTGKKSKQRVPGNTPPPPVHLQVLTWVLGSNREQQVLVISKQCWSRCGLAHQCLCFSLSWQVVRDKFLPWLVPHSAISFCWYEIPGEIAVSHRAIQLLMSLENQFVTEVVLVLFYKSQIFSQNTLAFKQINTKFDKFYA